MSFPAYADYRDSSVGWLGELPALWKAMRFSRVVSIAEGQVDPRVEPYASMVLIAPNHVEVGTGRLIALETAADQGADSGKYQFATGEVIYSKIRPALAKVVLAPCEGLCSADMYPLRGVEGLASPYLKWVLLCPEFTAWAVLESDRVAMPKINREKLNEFRLPVPSLTEQAAIAAFLDRETAKIDALVEAQRRLIELLKEKRQAVISHAVTKGLDPAAPMKDSGVEWLGEVPAHWEVVPIRTLFRFVKRQDGDELDVLSVYRDYGVISKASRDDNNNVTPEDLSKYQTVRPGDLVVNKMKAWQGSLGVSHLDGITSPDYAVFAPIHSGSADYLHLLLRSQLLPDVYRLISNGIRLAQWRLEPDKFKELRVPWPPISEQQAISTRLAELASRMELLAAEAEIGIALLQEHRTALISAAVTGKIDVRGLVPDQTARDAA